VDGNTYMLPNPFVVFATQNPTGASGTSLLPDSQIDRFMVRISMGYPSPKYEKAMIEYRKNGVNPMDSVNVLCDANKLLEMQSKVNNVFVHDAITDYIIALVNKTRGHKDLIRGASPRASLAFTAMAKAHAYLNGREYVVPKDVQAVFLPVITHRLILNPEAEVNGKNTVEIAKEILSSAFVPKV
jgi:MoxR-like ATPase